MGFRLRKCHLSVWYYCFFLVGGVIVDGLVGMRVVINVLGRNGFFIGFISYF